MTRFNIVFTDNIALLGYTAFLEFVEAFGQASLDAVQTIDEQFIGNVEKMRTHEFGFTSKYKETLLTVLKNRVGQKCLLTTDFILNCESTLSLKLKKVVCYLNEGIDIGEAQRLVNEEST